jgi:hypothetical protein
VTTTPHALPQLGLSGTEARPRVDKLKCALQMVGTMPAAAAVDPCPPGSCRFTSRKFWVIQGTASCRGLHRHPAASLVYSVAACTGSSKGALESFSHSTTYSVTSQSKLHNRADRPCMRKNWPQLTYYMYGTVWPLSENQPAPSGGLGPCTRPAMLLEDCQASLAVTGGNRPFLPMKYVNPWELLTKGLSLSL